MTPELKNAFEKAKKIIYEKQELMYDSMPVVHELEDGILIKFFSNWEDTNYKDIKIKKISSLDSKTEKIYLGFVPKGIKIKARSNNYTECIICLDGDLLIDIEGDLYNLHPFSKICVSPNMKYDGEAINDTYFILICCDLCK